MLDKSALNEKAEILNKELSTDVFKAYNDLLDFVKNYNSTPSINAKTVLLGAEIYENMTESGGMLLPDHMKAELTISALEIVAQVVNSEKREIPTIADIEKIRKKYIDKGRPVSVYEAEAISRKLGNFILQPISLKLRLGEITSVVGENGNGKSTLLKIISGELGIDSGKHQYPHFSPNSLNWLKIKRQIAYIPQDLKEWSSVHSRRDYIHFTAGAKGILGKANIETVDYIITRLGLKKYQNYPWDELSGGYKLKFELARQLSWSPKLLIMDEPLAHLDIKSQRHFLNDLRNLTNSLKSPMSVILSSQNLYEIENISDQVIFLNEGKATYNGRVVDIGKTTGNNSFLFSVNCNIPEFKDALIPLIENIKEVRSEHDEIMLVTSSRVKTSDILTQLISSNIKINYFRDISNSTRIFFENENN